jgi:hypothetical protein
MTLAEALDTAIEQTKHERYRWLCSEANPDAEQREAYRRLVLSLADPAVAEASRAARLIAENPAEPTGVAANPCGGCGAKAS